MRVISGKYKGMSLDGFDIEGTRPTMDRVKESMFAMIQANLKNSVCLDLFAGSGSLGIEALSNGAKYCYFVDNSAEIYKILTRNLSKLNATNYETILKNYKQVLEEFKIKNKKFDVIILDPPYKLNLINDILKFIYDNNLLNTNGIIICEYEGEMLEFDSFPLLKYRKYSSKHVSIYINGDI